MNINATIIVQAFNFFVVYWMLRIFLFRPVVTIIEHEKIQENALIDIINQQKKSLEIQEKERQRHWYICQEYFKTHQPHIFPMILSLSDETENDTEIIDTLSPLVLADTITQVHSILEEKIKHVH
jgi:hypothetical protein